MLLFEYPLTYTPPPFPDDALHDVNEHPLSKVIIDPLPSVALRTAPFPSLNVTLSTLSVFNNRVAPESATMSG